jgi:hypothetical protein
MEGKGRGVERPARHAQNKKGRGGEADSVGPEAFMLREVESRVVNSVLSSEYCGMPFRHFAPFCSAFCCNGRCEEGGEIPCNTVY